MPSDYWWLFGGADVTDNDMLSTALDLRNQKMSPHDIAKRLVITTGARSRDC